MPPCLRRGRARAFAPSRRAHRQADTAVRARRRTARGPRSASAHASAGAPPPRGLHSMPRAPSARSTPASRSAGGASDADEKTSAASPGRRLAGATRPGPTTSRRACALPGRRGRARRGASAAVVLPASPARFTFGDPLVGRGDADITRARDPPASLACTRNQPGVRRPKVIGSMRL